ncbi:hypothetical protein NQ314_005210 [Rhamnusium bicolor]|uniref:PiggyBac transposable element-derived protein domain-containing protein n=1 Tax=Rhamnusium bicolor TaxID=1586634 RepID=A0AAV8ZHK1_9CUCU|nr:hypothetical protein NQ314_005210 [Rhamnusium bicolor]
MTEQEWHKNKVIYFDNYFNDIDLLERLKLEGTLACGTIRKDRRGVPKNIASDKSLQRGDFDHRTSNTGITFYKWKENRIVTFASNFHGTRTIQVKRKLRDGTTSYVNAPEIVKDYNTYMGGVDYHDQLRQCYGIDRRSRKWWHRIFWGCIEIAFVFNMVLSRKDLEDIRKIIEEKITLSWNNEEFMTKIIESIHNKIGEKYEKLITKQNDSINALKKEIAALKKGNTQLEKEVDNNQQFSRSLNIRIFGIPQESEKEDTKKIIFLSSEGDIQKASCNCPKGLDVCHHMASLAIFAHKNLSVTDAACKWSEVKPSQEDTILTAEMCFASSSHPFFPLLKEISEESVEQFKTDLKACGPTGLGWLLSPEPTINEETVVDVEQLLFSEEYGNHGDKISFLKKKLSLTKDRIVEVQKLTVGQMNNPAWYIARKHRLTASNFGQVMKACKRGRFPPTLFQTLTGASPDGIIDDDTLIEVECPFKYKDSVFSDCLIEIKDYIVSFNGESFILNDAHNYYHQIQELQILTVIIRYFIEFLYCRMNNMDKYRIAEVRKNLLDQLISDSESSNSHASTCNSSPVHFLPSDVENMFDSDDSVWDPDYHSGSPKLNFDYRSDTSSGSLNKNEQSPWNHTEVGLSEHNEKRTDENVTKNNVESQNAHSTEATIKRTRKRLRNPENWTRYVKKTKREHGLQYKDEKGRIHIPRQCVAQTPLKGKYIKKAIPADTVDGVRRHIESFPHIESHYCRADRVRLYLDPCLSIEKMYRLYLESDFGKLKPVKSHKYREVFLKEYNFGFLLSKKDRCDTCEKFNITEDKNEEVKTQFELHVKNKNEGKIERDFDRKTYKTSDTTAVLSYNLTVHCSTDKITYCALWYEAIFGRNGNHIASALVTILNRISEENPNINKFILWSDSCVPQNRNSHMSLAIKYFLHINDRINTIEQKFSEPGHSLVQEIDSVHSKIEKYLKFREIHSPVSLLRHLTNIPSGKAPLKIIQLNKGNFLNFQAVSQTLNFKDVPFTKLKQINYKKDDPLHITFKCGFNESSLLSCIRLNKRETRGSAKKQGKNDHININFSLVKVITEMLR